MEPSGPSPWLIISPDRLAARMTVPRGQLVELTAARDLLHSFGLKHGIQGDVLRAVAHPVQTDQDLLLASGEPPAELAALEITPLVAAGVKVAAGQVVANCAHRGPLDGVGVDGQPIPGVLPSQVGVGLALNDDGTITARRDGVLRQRPDGGWQVVIDGVAEVALDTIAVQNDAAGTEAWIELPPRHYLPGAVLHRLLGERSLVRGVRGEVFAEASLPEVDARRLVVASGIAPIAGHDGRLEMIIDEAVHLKVDAGGRVDWHDHGRREDVAEATRLARVLPPTIGVHGTDVRGRLLATKPGKPLDPARVMGDGVRLSVVSPDLIEAAVPGHFFRDRQQRLCVQSRLIVDGDVDFHHGNIDTTLSVLVKGDVKAGFAIKSAGNIEVMGVIEDARISAQGSLVVRGGILPGSNRVKAHGDIDARYVSNREVKCHTLRVAASLRWSRVMATGEVIAKEILAGELICAGNVTVDQLGSVDGTVTRLQVGTNPFEERQFFTAQEEHERLTCEVKSGKERCKFIAHHLAEDPALADDLRTALADFSAACAKLAACETTLERHLERQADRARQQVTAMVQVGGMAHRGVELHFDEAAKLVLDQDLARPQFRLAEGEIVW